MYIRNSLMFVLKYQPSSLKGSQILAHSSEPSQQSQTPSLTRLDGTNSEKVHQLVNKL
jgi:hypothetical protein